MKEIRKGNDIVVTWSLKREGEPFILEGLSLTLYLKSMHEKKRIDDFSVRKDKIHWTFFGKDQDRTGTYSLELVVNEGKEGMMTTDACNFVRIVSCSCKTSNGLDDCGIKTEVVDIESEVEYGGSIIVVDKVLSPDSENAIANSAVWNGLKQVKDSIPSLSEYAKKEDIHTPDWNAGEGEEGHIKNRTHYADFVEVDIPEDIASSEVELTIPNIVGAPILVHYATLNTSKYLKISANDKELHVLSYGPAFKIRRGDGNNIFISGHNFEDHRLYIATHFVALNEIFLPETIARKSEIQSKLTELSTGIVIKKGDAENSAVLKGGDNQAISEGGVALGKNNIVGLKGWYYSSIYKENDNTISVYLSNEQKAFNSDEDFKTESQTADESLPNLVEILGVNAVISLVNAGKYDDKFIVIGGSNGVVRLQTIDKSALPFDIITGQSVINYEDYSIYCLSKPDAGIAELGKYSFAVGYNNKATNGESTAFGYNNHAYGKFSFVEGKDNKASYASHAEGRSNTASGSISHAEGRDNVASGYLSHVEGGNNIAEGARSHAEGHSTKAIEESSHAEGEDSQASGKRAHAEGYGAKAIGNSSHAEGYFTTAKGGVSHAEGDNTTATGDRSHAEGNTTKAEGINSHAEGNKSQALGPHSHAEGNETITEGSCAHAEGYKSQALGKYSHAEGNNTISKNEAEHACGKYNSSTQSNDSAQATRFSIGIGTPNTDRKNAVEVKANGDVYIIGVGGYDGINSDSAQTLQEILANL